MKYFSTSILAFCMAISVVFDCCVFVAAAENTLRGRAGHELNEEKESSSPDQQRELFSIFGHGIFGPHVSNFKVSNVQNCNLTLGDRTKCHCKSSYFFYPRYLFLNPLDYLIWFRFCLFRLVVNDTIGSCSAR